MKTEKKLHFGIKQEKHCYLCKHKAMLKWLSEKRNLRISIGEPEITISAKTGDIRLNQIKGKRKEHNKMRNRSKWILCMGLAFTMQLPLH